MELFNVDTTSARPTPPVITQPTSSADIVTTVSPGTHPARAARIPPTEKTVAIFLIFYLLTKRILVTYGAGGKDSNYSFQFLIALI
jgi:hypothetical protein